jgi:hypothetical protein
VRRTNGLELAYTLPAEQLNKKNRNKGTGNWLTERHNMYVKTMWIRAYRKLSGINVQGGALAFEGDVEQDDQDWAQPETTPITTDETPF